MTNASRTSETRLLRWTRIALAAGLVLSILIGYLWLCWNITRIFS